VAFTLWGGSGEVKLPPSSRQGSPTDAAVTELTSRLFGSYEAALALGTDFWSAKDFQVRDTASAAPHSNALELCCGVEFKPGGFMPALLLQFGARRLGGCPLYYSLQRWLQVDDK
jgi:hypothetical protein